VTAQTIPTKASINDNFPEDFDIKDELKIDKEVYKYTGQDFDISQELKSDKSDEEKKTVAEKESAK